MCVYSTVQYSTDKRMSARVVWDLLAVRLFPTWRKVDKQRYKDIVTMLLESFTTRSEPLKALNRKTQPIVTQFSDTKLGPP